jgi:hypothetical protein
LTNKSCDDGEYDKEGFHYLIFKRREVEGDPE